MHLSKTKKAVNADELISRLRQLANDQQAMTEGLRSEPGDFAQLLVDAIETVLKGSVTSR